MKTGCSCLPAPSLDIIVALYHGTSSQPGQIIRREVSYVSEGLCVKDALMKNRSSCLWLVSKYRWDDRSDRHFLSLAIAISTSTATQCFPAVLTSCSHDRQNCLLESGGAIECALSYVAIRSYLTPYRHRVAMPLSKRRLRIREWLGTGAEGWEVDRRSNCQTEQNAKELIGQRFPTSGQDYGEVSASK